MLSIPEAPHFAAKDQRLSSRPCSDWAYLACVMLAAVPFPFLSIFYGAGVNLSVFAAAVATLLAALTVLGPTRLGVGLGARPVGSAVAVLALLVLIVGYQYSISKDSSFVPSWGLALAPMAYLCVRELGEQEQHRLWLALSAVGACFATLSVWRLVTEGERATWPLTDPNNYACLLYLLLLPSIHLLLCRASTGPRVSPPLSIAGHSLIFIGLVALFATQSRTAALVVVVALAVWLALAFGKRLRPGPVAIIVVLTGLAFIAAKLSLPHLYGRGQVASLSAGVGARAALTSAAFRMFLDYPVTGIGVYVFPLLYRFRRDVTDQDTAGGFVHNDYLQLLSEGGVLLAACLVAFAGLTAWAAFRSLRAPSDSRSFEKLGLAMALGAALAHAFVNFVVYTPILAYLLGAIAGMLHPRGAEAVAVPALPKLKALASGLLVFGWLGWGFLALDTYSQGVLNRQAGVPFAAQLGASPESMLAYARFAQRVNPNRGMPALAEAVLLERKLVESPSSEELRRATLESYRHARRVDPWNPYVNLQMYRFVRNNAAVGAMLEDGERPVDLLLHVVALDPTFVPALDTLHQYALEIGHEELFVRVLRERVLARLPLLARMDRSASLRYLATLDAWAKANGDESLEREVSDMGQRLDVST